MKRSSCAQNEHFETRGLTDCFLELASVANRKRGSNAMGGGFHFWVGKYIWKQRQADHYACKKSCPFAAPKPSTKNAVDSELPK